jgi:hypothetical protein
MSLCSVVALYRACNKPPVEDGEFECRMEFAPIREYVLRVMESRSADFERLEVDGVDYLYDEALPEKGHQIVFCLRVATSSSATFHANLERLLETDPQISRGHVPADFYLVAEDFYSKDTDVHTEVRALHNVCRLIKGLAELAHYHDGRTSTRHLNLVFIQPSEVSRAAPVVLETRVTTELLEGAHELDPHLVETLARASASVDPHYSAKVGVFATSLATFVGARASVSSPFTHLVVDWKEFVETYHRDLGTYLSGFAFHKAKREVAEAELKIAGELSKLLSEITGQLLSIPVSFAVVLTIPRAETLLERLVLFVGVLIASVVVYKVIGNQRRQLERIVHAKNLVLGAINGKKEMYPKDLIASIEAMTGNLLKNERSLDNSLNLFAWLSLLPVVTAGVTLGFLYFDDLRDALLVIHRWWDTVGY